jgi:phage tail sheath protein FI
MAGFVGVAPAADREKNKPVYIANWSEFCNHFAPEEETNTPLSHAVYGYFLNGGTDCYVVNVGKDGPISDRNAGLELLKKIDQIAIVAAPGFTDAASYDALLSHCEELQDRVAILDGPRLVDDLMLLTSSDVDQGGLLSRASPPGAGAFYYPWIEVADPFNMKQRVEIPPSGHIAGIWARSDLEKGGVHRAPANMVVRGALRVTHQLTRAEQGILNPEGVNCIRQFSREGILVWGARTRSDDNEWKYLNVRRLFNMIRESIAENTRWMVFEPNDRNLWRKVRRDISAFLTGLWRDGMLMGSAPEDAFYVKCDGENNPQDVIDRGEVRVNIGIAPVKPAEFIIFRISQSQAGAEVEIA